MIAFDAGVLIAYKNPQCPEAISLRVDGLIEEATRRKQKIILPSPALAEYLAGAGKDAAAAAQQLLTSSRAFRVADFGQRASIEIALVIASVKGNGQRKHEGSSWAKAKFDWQIAAIAKVEGATTLYTTDKDVVRAATHFGVTGMLVEDIPLPASALQILLPLDARAGKSDDFDSPR